MNISRGRPTQRVGRPAAPVADPARRVCQKAEHRTSEGKIPAPGDRRSEGQEKGKGVPARLRREPFDGGLSALIVPKGSA